MPGTLSQFPVAFDSFLPSVLVARAVACQFRFQILEVSQLPESSTNGATKAETCKAVRYCRFGREGALPYRAFGQHVNSEVTAGFEVPGTCFGVGAFGAQGLSKQPRVPKAKHAQFCRHLCEDGRAGYNMLVLRFSAGASLGTTAQCL